MRSKGPGFRAQGPVWFAGLLLLISLTAAAQTISFGGMAGAAKKEHVTLVSDSIVVAAGKPQMVELRFRVDDGFHINSHHPADELLIPTSLKLDAAKGFRVLSEAYPKGEAFRLTVGEGETLSVYQGEFRVQVRLVAPRGASTLTGGLHYQACDDASCFPPRTLPVKIAVTGR